MDKNPYFGADESFVLSARRVTDMLWETTRGDLSRVPQDYLNSLAYAYSDGSESFLDLLAKVEFSEGVAYEEFSEVVESLLVVDPEQWPDPNEIVSIPSGKLLYEIEPELDFSEFEFDFADGGDMSDKMEKFLKKVISSVYTDGVSDVTDAKGNPPNAQNNYLMAPDGKSFSGIFYDKDPERETKKFSFAIREKKSGAWEIRY